MTTDIKLGPALLALRRRLNLTLSDVAEKTGLSTSTLSKAERGLLSLTYDKLVQVSQGLGVDIGTLFEDGEVARNGNGAGGRRSINLQADGSVIDTDNYHHVYLSTDLLKKKFIPILADIRARSLAEFGELVRHPGEEFAFVVEGSVAIHTEHYAPAILQRGESMYFDSDMAHAYVAVGKGPCRVLSICSAPQSALEEATRAHVGLAAASESATPQKDRKSKTTKRR